MASHVAGSTDPRSDGADEEVQDIGPAYNLARQTRRDPHNRDLRFETRLDLKISELMTKDTLVTVPVGTTLEEAHAILHKHRVEKLPVVDDKFHLRGLITYKDIQKRIAYPNDCKDTLGRLRVGAAVGATGDNVERASALVKANVDVLVVDTAHGHSSRVISAVKRLRAEFPNVDLIAGNVATEEGAEALAHVTCPEGRSGRRSG